MLCWLLLVRQGGWLLFRLDLGFHCPDAFGAEAKLSQIWFPGLCLQGCLSFRGASPSSVTGCNLPYCTPQWGSWGPSESLPTSYFQNLGTLDERLRHLLWEFLDASAPRWKVNSLSPGWIQVTMWKPTLYTIFRLPWASQVVLVANSLTVNAGDIRLRFDPWAGKISWRRAWQPTPVFLPGESHGQKSLRGYSPWGHKELETIEVT